VKKIIATVEMWKEGGMFTSYCPELDVASCGHTLQEAKKNLREVIEIQLEETAKLGTLKDFLVEAGYVIDDEVLKTEKKIVGFEELSISVGALG
jgi:predicted RNase H-like HicB family nuclease